MRLDKLNRLKDFGVHEIERVAQKMLKLKLM